MNRISRFIYGLGMAAALAAVAVSCLESSVAEDSPSLSTDRDLVEPAPEGLEGVILTDTLLICSNRSWSAVVTYSDPGNAGWIELGVEENENLSKSSSSSSLPFTVANNPFNTVREASIHVYYEGLEKVVSVRQNGITYRLVPSVTEISGISDLASVRTFNLDTNIPWKIEVEDGATMDVSVTPESGTGYSEISVNVGDNPDFTEKTATLLISADKGYEYDPVEVRLVQKACDPFVTIDREKSSTSIFPIDAVDTVYFSTNGDWTARLENATEGITLGESSGSRGLDNSIVVNFGTNLGSSSTGSPRTATVIIESNGVSDTITITQKYWFQIKLMFHTGSALVSASAWPLLAPLTSSQVPSSSSKAAYKEQFVSAELKDYPGLSIGFYMTSGIWRNSSQGLDLKGDAGDYIQIPVVDGLKLVGAGAWSGKSSFPVKITDESGKTVTGGDAMSGWPVHELKCWILSGTSASAVYRMTLGSSVALYVHGLEYYYE